MDGRERLSFSARALVTSNAFWLTLIVLAVLVLFGPTLNDWFQTDDFLYLRAGHLGSAPEVFGEAFDVTYYARNDEGVDFIRHDRGLLPFWAAYRPLYFSSFEVMYLAFGDHAVGYHAVSIGVHVANILLVWLIASRLLRAGPAPLLAAAIFAVHPAYAAAVAWVADIGTLLATFCGLLALLFFMNAVASDRLDPRWYVGSIICYAVSILFNQETLLWVAVFAGVLFLLKTGVLKRLLEARNWLLLLPFAILAAATYGLQRWILARAPLLRTLHHIGPNMLTQFKNLASGAVFPVKTNLAEAHFLAFVGLLVLMALLLILMLARRTTAASPLVPLVVVGWFLVSLAPFLGINAFFEIGVLNRKLYAAGPSLAILLALFATSLVNLAPLRLKVPANVLASVVFITALIGGMAMSWDQRREVGGLAAESEQFVEALTEEYPSLPQGSTLYVVGAPFAIRVFSDLYLVTSVDILYGRGIDVRAITEEQAEALDVSQEDSTYLFRYHAAAR